MLKEIARYGSFKKRDAPSDNELVTDVVGKSVDNKRKCSFKLTDVYNPFEIYYYDVDFTKEVEVDECCIHEQDNV